MKDLVKLSLLSASILLSAPIAISAHSQNRENERGPTLAVRKSSKHSAIPEIEDFETRENSSSDRELREERESRVHGFYPMISDPGKEVDGQQETTNLTILDYSGHLDALPASDVTSVLIATVLNARAFLSHDRTYVYSDYEIRVDQIFKQDEAHKLMPSQKVTASRTGGSVRFPSGHITNYLIYGEGLPEVGSQYVFFLWRPTVHQSEYQITTGYELKNGKVQALDDMTSMGQFDDMDATVFLSKVQASVKSAMKPIQ